MEVTSGVIVEHMNSSSSVFSKRNKMQVELRTLYELNGHLRPASWVGMYKEFSHQGVTGLILMV
jgi:hypothetical protein